MCSGPFSFMPNEFELFFLLSIPTASLSSYFHTLFVYVVDLFLAFLFHSYSHGGEVSAINFW